MSMDIGTFTNRVTQTAKRFTSDPNRITELSAIATALGSDITTHDATLKRAPAGLIPGQQANSPFTNAVLKHVNSGKGGNLTTAAMAAAITSGISNFIPPSNTGAAPSVSRIGGATDVVGSQYAVSSGTWTPAGATPTRQWLRSGANIGGATATSYTTVAADGGTSLSCRVTMTNNAGSGSAVSNAVAIT